MIKWKTFNNIIWKLMAGVLAIFCILCLYFSFFRANYSDSTIDVYNPFVLLIASVFYIAFLLAVRKGLSRMPEKSQRIIAFILILIFFVGLLFVGLSTRIIAKVDLRHAYIEAINMLETGVMTDKWQFERFPHQKAVAFILYFVYRIASLFGSTDYRMIGIIFNAIMMTLALIFLYKFVCDCKGRVVAILAEVIFVCNPVMYFYASYFYSDTLCLPFMMGGLWLGGKGLQESQRLKRIYFLLASAVMIVLGAEIRATVIFALFAVLFIAVSTESRKSIAITCITLTVGLLIGGAMYQQINTIYAGNLAEDLGHPVTHYLMMGSNKETNGGWSYADDHLTSSLETHQEKVKGNLEVIVERIRSMGLSGYLELIKNKIALVWGDGRMGFQSFNAQMERYNFIYEYSMGDKAIFLRETMQFMRCSLYFLMLSALVMFIYKKEWAFSDRASVVVCLAGFVFYVFWEVQPRYSLMYLTTMSVLAGTGIETLYSTRKIQSISIVMQEKIDSDRKNITLVKDIFSKLACSILCFAMLFTALFWVADYYNYVGNIQERSEIRVKQDVDYGGTLRIDREGILQSFMPKNAFNCIAIKLRNDKVAGEEYCFQVLNKDKNILTEQKFLSDSVKDNNYKQFRFDTIYPSSEDDIFFIRIFAVENYEKFIKIPFAYWKKSEAYASGYDYYPDGNLIKPMMPKHTDIAFRVTNIKMRSIVSYSVYLLL